MSVAILKIPKKKTRCKKQKTKFLLKLFFFNLLLIYLYTNNRLTVKIRRKLVKK